MNSLQFIWPQDVSREAISFSSLTYEPENKGRDHCGREFFPLVPKSPAYVFGEWVVRPMLDYSWQLFDSLRSGVISLNKRVTKLCPNFPVVSAEVIKFQDNEVAVPADTLQRVAQVGLNFTIYVGGDTSVSTINPMNNTVITSFAITPGTGGMAITPDNRYVYVVRTQSNTICAIDAYNNTVLAILSIGIHSSPFDVAITPNGLYGYVSCGNGNVSVFDTMSNVVIARIPISHTSLPRGIAITPDGLYAYVANSGSSSLTVIATANNTVISTVNLTLSYNNVQMTPEVFNTHVSPNNVQITPDGSKAYVTAFMDGFLRSFLYIIDIQSNTVANTLDISQNNPTQSPISMGITPDGLYAYVGFGEYPVGNSGLVAVIDTNHKKITTVFAAGAGMPNGIAFSPDSQYAYIACDNNPYAEVSVIPTSYNLPVYSIDVGLGASGIVTTKGS